MRVHRLHLISAFLLAVLVGCGGGGGAEGSGEAQSREQREEKKPEPPRTVMMEAGDALTVSLQRALSTSETPAGTPFEATTQAPVVEDGVVAIPAGSTVHGSVSSAERAAAIGGTARMQLTFNRITTPDGRRFDIDARPLTLEGKSTARGDVEKVVGGAVGGGLLGGILGGGEGAAKGAAAGTVAGGIWAVATRGNDIELAPGTRMVVTLSSALPVTLASSSP